jgi:anaerobic selenocysteine-containing dehydrogenase
MSAHGKMSRRTWLKGFSAAAGMPLVMASASAQAKASKSAVHYQDRPNGKMRMCQTCRFLIAAGGRSGVMGCPMGGGMMGEGACQLTEGSMRPMGYCDLYAPLCA